MGEGRVAKVLRFQEVAMMIALSARPRRPIVLDLRQVATLEGGIGGSFATCHTVGVRRKGDVIGQADRNVLSP